MKELKAEIRSKLIEWCDAYDVRRLCGNEAISEAAAAIAALYGREMAELEILHRDNKRHIVTIAKLRARLAEMEKGLTKIVNVELLSTSRVDLAQAYDDIQIIARQALAAGEGEDAEEQMASE